MRLMCASLVRCRPQPNKNRFTFKSSSAIRRQMPTDNTCTLHMLVMCAAPRSYTQCAFERTCASVCACVRCVFMFGSAAANTQWRVRAREQACETKANQPSFFNEQRDSVEFSALNCMDRLFSSLVSLVVAVVGDIDLL